MEFINLDGVVRTETAGHSSKGNQLKWRLEDVWYKADYMGYEGLAEVVVANLLDRSSLAEHVHYEPVMIQYEGRQMRGCKSRNFLQPDEELITIDKLFRQFTGRNLTGELGRIPEVRDRIIYTVENVIELTGLKDFGAYLTAALELDALFLNEDRHMNNIAVIYQKQDKKFHLCPYFDHGLSLFSDTKTDYTMDTDVFECWNRITAKPFSRDFDEQADCAELLFGKQLKVWFEDGDISEELEGFAGVYEPEILRRVEEVLRQQKRKYGNLFCTRKIAR